MKSNFKQSACKMHSNCLKLDLIFFKLTFFFLKLDLIFLKVKVKMCSSTALLGWRACESETRHSRRRPSQLVTADHCRRQAGREARAPITLSSLQGTRVQPRQLPRGAGCSPFNPVKCRAY